MYFEILKALAKFHSLNKNDAVFISSGSLCLGHYGYDLAVSVFFHLHIVSRSTAELSILIDVFMGLGSHANLPCLVNLALNIPHIMIYVSYEGLHAHNSPTADSHVPSLNCE